ncbi:tRNA pseudouridine(55) synthase TruB [Alphaproteobacteria bacterium]|nr:tRNA pseudouridine(55) synthase TruB [Alphaproteobacteria bacterium]
MKVNGWLLVDKPEGISSRKVVNLISNSLSIKKVGHAGTLDPMASGLLPIAIGEATKTIGVIQQFKKHYEFTIKWGEKTSTDDKMGTIISSTTKRPNLETINKNIKNFIGKIEQIPPKFSAIKFNGKRAYLLARNNLNFSLNPRTVFIETFRIKKYLDESHCSFECICSKGTYIRSLGRDLGEAMNCFGHLYELRRTHIGNFSTKCAILLDLSKKLIHSSAILKNILPIEKVLESLPFINLTEKHEIALRNGQRICLDELIENEHKKNFFLNKSNDTYMICKNNNRPICFFKIDNNFIKPTRVFNL